MATSEATGGYRFQVKRGCNSPTCRPGEGWWGDSCSQFVPREVMCWAWTFQMLHSGKPESHQVLKEVTALGNRGCDTEEAPPSPCFQEVSRKETSLTTPWLLSPSHTNHSNRGSSGQDIWKRHQRGLNRFCGVFKNTPWETQRKKRQWSQEKLLELSSA